MPVVARVPRVADPLAYGDLLTWLAFPNSYSKDYYLCYQRPHGIDFITLLLSSPTCPYVLQSHHHPKHTAIQGHDLEATPISAVPQC